MALESCSPMVQSATNNPDNGCGEVEEVGEAREGEAESRKVLTQK